MDIFSCLEESKILQNKKMICIYSHLKIVLGAKFKALLIQLINVLLLSKDLFLNK